MKTLDRSRAFGTVCGQPSVPGATYDQDGVLFDSGGLEIIAIDTPLVNSLNDDQELISIMDIASHIDDEPTPIVRDHIDEDEQIIPYVSDEEKVLSMSRAGKSEKAIRRATGLHHNTIRRILNEATKPDVSME